MDQINEYEKALKDVANDKIRYPKGTSWKYTQEINRKFGDAVNTLQNANIDVSGLGNFEQINALQKKLMAEWETTHDDAKYKPLIDALEVIEDKIYNDAYIRMAPYGY